MRAEWVRVYKVGDDVATFLHLYADDDSELVALTEDEIRLVELAIRSEQHEDRHSAAQRAFTEAYALAAGDELADETVDRTGAGVVSEPDSPPAVVGGLDDVDAVVEAPRHTDQARRQAATDAGLRIAALLHAAGAPPEPKGAGRPTKVTLGEAPA